MEPAQPRSTSASTKSTVKEFTPTLVQTEWGTTPKENRPAIEVKIKQKTRAGRPSIEKDFDFLSISSKSPSPINTKSEARGFKVGAKKTVYDIFSTLFFSSNGGSNRVKWDAFVDAMAKVGFIAQRNGGSAFTFEPEGESK